MPRIITGIDRVCLLLDRPIGEIVIPAFAVVVNDEERTTGDNVVVGYTLGQHGTPCFSISLGADEGGRIKLDNMVNKFGRCDLIVDDDPSIELGCLSRTNPPVIATFEADQLTEELMRAEQQHLRHLNADAGELTLPIPFDQPNPLPQHSWVPDGAIVTRPNWA
jgi:hypothetical protein